MGARPQAGVTLEGGRAPGTGSAADRPHRRGPPRERVNAGLVRRAYPGHTCRGDEFDHNRLQ